MSRVAPPAPPGDLERRLEVHRRELGIHADPASNRRVLAVLAYLRSPAT